MVPTMFPPPKVFLCSDTDYLKLQHTIYIHVYICIPMNVSKYVYEQYDIEDDQVVHHSIRVILNEARFPFFFLLFLFFSLELEKKNIKEMEERGKVSCGDRWQVVFRKNNKKSISYYG